MLTVGDALAEIPTTKTGRPADFDEVYRILTSYKIGENELPVIIKQIVALRDSLGMLKGANKKKLVEGEYRWIQDGQ